MKHAREDYDRIQDPDGKIGEDEPVMLFRAQDELFRDVCFYYAGLLRARYGVHKEQMAQMVEEHGNLGAAWPKQKEPDL